MLKRSTKGFTLIELMVAMGLFATVMTIASGAYLIMISVNREAQSITRGINSVSYALEIMTRNIRTGTGYPSGPSSCGDVHGAGADSMTFTDVAGDQVTYSLAPSVGTAHKIVQAVNGVLTDLTDPSVDISTLTFYCTGALPSDAYQANVILVVSGKVLSAKATKDKEFIVQTTATMRALDL